MYYAGWLRLGQPVDMLLSAMVINQQLREFLSFQLGWVEVRTDISIPIT
jgi:hypothetical protein